jgi:hypothetical protein
MAGTKNLVPIPERTKDEQKRITTAGGKASGKARRAKRDFQQACRWLLESKIPDDSELNDLFDAFGIRAAKDRTLQAAILLRQAQRATGKDGTIASAEFLRDTAGFAPQKDGASANLNLNVAPTETLKIYIPDNGRDDGIDGEPPGGSDG